MAMLAVSMAGNGDIAAQKLDAINAVSVSYGKEQRPDPFKWECQECGHVWEAPYQRGGDIEWLMSEIGVCDECGWPKEE